MSGRLTGLNVVVTRAGEFMGPAIAELFRSEGAHVFADERELLAPGAAADLVREAGRADVLIANLMRRNPRTPVVDTPEAEWLAMFDEMVHPLHRLVRAVLPQMIERRSGKIVVIGSANALRGTAVRAAYSAARGAQIAYVKNVGVEVAPHAVNVNIIAQNFVSNPTSYPPEKLASPEMAAQMKDVPAGRPAQGWESAALALYLSSSDSNFFFGQVFPFAGGWAT
jgi:2-keto-3-deoxy-L-fuconate dehydrogenase